MATKITSRPLIFKPPPGTNPPMIRKAFDRQIVRTEHGVVVTDTRVKTTAYPLTVPFSEILDAAREEVDVALKEEGQEKTADYEEGVRMIAERIVLRLQMKGIVVT